MIIRIIILTSDDSHLVGRFYTGGEVIIYLEQNRDILIQVGFTLYVVTGVNTDFTRPDRDDFIVVECDPRHKRFQTCQLIAQKVCF